ncbi:MAG: nucleoside-diphosphate kinase [DPANN group archaeon]|nr:nucleoside-diphosphate kinase [DPANN group archaeon]
MEDTLVLIKPDGVEKKLTGEIISRFEKAGLELVAIKTVNPTAELLERHYVLTDDWVKNLASKTRDAMASKGIKMTETDLEIAKRVQSWLKQSLSSGKVVAMVLRGNHAVSVVRKLVGATEPKSSGAGTIRGDFSTDSYDLADKEQRSVKNIIHASGTVDEAKHEINIWFS